MIQPFSNDYFNEIQPPTRWINNIYHQNFGLQLRDDNIHLLLCYDAQAGAIISWNSRKNSRQHRIELAASV